MTDAPTTAELIERFGRPDDLAEVGEVTNVDRAYFAAEPYSVFVRGVTSYSDVDAHHPEVLYEQVGDLICDLLHFATMNGIDPEAVHESGWRHFVAEVGLGYNA